MPPDEPTARTITATVVVTLLADGTRAAYSTNLSCPTVTSLLDAEAAVKELLDFIEQARAVGEIASLLIS